MSKNPLSNWYGYEKKVTPASSSFTESDLYIRRTYSGRYNLSPEFAKTIRYTSDDDTKRRLASLYFPPADGVTEEDFLKFIENHTFEPARDGYLNWRSIVALDKSGIPRESKHDTYTIKSVYSNFFSLKQRTDRLFRIIEINEFLKHTKPDNLTFAEFLETDKEVAEKTKNLMLQEHSVPLNTYFHYNLPDFLEFSSRVTLKTRNLLLPLTKAQMLKVFDYESNPYTKANASASYSFDFAELYIGAAIGEIKEAPVKTLEPEQISNAITLALISKTEYWEKVAASRRTSGFLSEILQELEKIAYNMDSFKRNFAYLIHEGVLEKLDAKEIVGVVLGFDKSHRWIESSKGKSTLEVLMEIMQAGKLDPVVGSKLIAHIVNNHLQPIVLDPEFDWSIVDDSLAAWVYQILPHSEKKQTLALPYLSKIMSRY